MSRRSTVIAIPLAVGVALAASLVATPASAVTYTSGNYACGSLYPSGKTSGYTTIRVTVAGVTTTGAYGYPGGTVYATGTSHSGTVTSYASDAITSWGFTGCTQL